MQCNRNGRKTHDRYPSAETKKKQKNIETILYLSAYALDLDSMVELKGKERMNEWICVNATREKERTDSMLYYKAMHRLDDLERPLKPRYQLERSLYPTQRCPLILFLSIGQCEIL